MNYNDYSKIEKLFYKKTGTNINFGFNKNIEITKSASIIIPVYNNLKLFKKCFISLQNQYIPDELLKNIEVVLVDDGSKDKANIIKIIRKENKYFDIKLLQLKKNYGRATARNLGILYSKGEILIFLDADMVIGKFLIFNHLLRHQFCDKIIVIGFRDNICYNSHIISIENLKNKKIIKPNYKNDFRYKKYIPLSWENTYKDKGIENFNKLCYILHESNYFKYFNKSNHFGVWSLPNILLACNVSVKKCAIVHVGAFDKDFKSWGMEDNYLGYKLMKSNFYFIPVISAIGFHIRHNNITHLKEKKESFLKNLRLYNKKIKMDFRRYDITEWEKEMQKYFKDKYCIKNFK